MGVHIRFAISRKKADEYIEKILDHEKLNEGEMWQIIRDLYVTFPVSKEMKRKALKDAEIMEDMRKERGDESREDYEKRTKGMR